MGSRAGFVAQLRSIIADDPLLALALGAALIALATTPIAFAILARLDWFRARRGRVMQKPEFWSVVCSMLLVMGIPAIFAAITLKSRHFDASRYEFDPNQSLSVIDVGGQSGTVEGISNSLRVEREHLEVKEKDLLNAVKKFDDALLPLRAAALQHPATYQALPNLLDRLAEIHRAVGLDAPQQLMVLTAPPAAIAGAPGAPAVAVPVAASAPVAAAVPVGHGITAAEAEIELAGVPEPQKPIAAMLPLTDIPVGWTLGKLGDKHIETFNAEDLYVKIDGRAESFLQYGVTGMAYCNYQLDANSDMEVQLYIFDMGDAIKAFGKYGSEISDETEPVPVGKEGYTSAGSVFFHASRFYTQIVSSTDDPKAAAFALEIAKRVAAKQGAAPKATAEPKPAVAAIETPKASAAAEEEVTPEAIFKLMPTGSGRSSDKYAAQDVFGYSFFSEVFLADYSEGNITWQGFIRPYPDAKAAAEVFEKYLAQVKSFGAEVKKVETPDADQFVVVDLFGLIDAIFLKGNAVVGVNGSSDAARAESFSKAFAKQLPKTVPALPASPKPKPAAASGGEGS